MTAPILIGYDGSEDAANAIACAGRVLAPRRALVVHCFADTTTELGAATAEEAERLAAEGAQLALAARLDAQPVVAEQRGKPWETLLGVAEKHAAAALVVGARGRSALASALLGSFSNGLVHYSPLPVLVVPANADPQERRGPVLLCYDGSPNSKQAVEQAGVLLSGKSAVALNVWEPWRAPAPGLAPPGAGGMVRELDEIAEKQSGELAGQGAQLAAAAGLDAAPLSIRCKDAVWRGVVIAATEQDASVIVLGTHGQTGLSAVLGSVSYGVVHHARLPILIVPSENRQVP